MEPIAVRTLARSIGIDCTDMGTITRISTDSREVEPGCLFVCIEGERFDGHDFAAKAIAGGAAYVVAHKPVEGVDPARVFRVDNTLDANIRLAGAYRRQFSPLCVGVTGSVGKTTTKDLIAGVLSGRWKTLKTPGNRNNEIGVPAALCEITGETEALVVEMGMTAPGDVEKLAQAAQPDIGVITWVGTSHIERLGSRENILRAKLELASALRPNTPLVLCADNDLLGNVRQAGAARIVRYGIDAPQVQVRAKDLSGEGSGTRFVIEADGEEYPAYLPVPGRHNVLDALAAFAVGREAGLTPEEILRGIAAYEPSGMRQKKVVCGGVTVTEDCYNASPDSVLAALRTFSEQTVPGRRIAVLGDMLELGDTAMEAHRQAGETAARLGMDVLCCVGEYAGEMASAAQAAGLPRTAAFASKKELDAFLAGLVRSGDAVWFKASRGVKLEESVQALYRALEQTI